MKLKLCLLLIFLLFLTACGDILVDEEPEAVDEAELVEELSVDEIEEEILFSGMGEDDLLQSLIFEGGEIKVIIELAEDELFSSEDMAVTRYSQASDALLIYEGWEVLTIEYTEVGVISIDRSESETNELDMDYFPVDIIEQNLN
ncbi:hypothetical protein [Alkalihalobacillus sp. 1P02AB]|uniref:hypothetical protein n=1 Tax=Alkalihalobacillus sp. 1P02AB TaxID=3132260 RepID=UPI0039A676D0